MHVAFERVSIRQLKEFHTRTHPAKLALDPELAAELADEEAELAEERSEESPELLAAIDAGLRSLEKKVRRWLPGANSKTKCGNGLAVALTEEADADLGDVVTFLAKKSPAAAERFGLELVALIFSLDQMPNRGAPVRKRPGLRKIAHRQRAPREIG